MEIRQKQVPVKWAEPSWDPRSLETLFLFAQNFIDRPVYSIKKVAGLKTASKSTIYKRLHDLESLGLAKFGRDSFEIRKGTVSQPLHIFKLLVPSLLSLKSGRRFGRYYNETDVNFAKKNLPDKSLVTLDYAAWDLTRFQTPRDLFVYVDDVDNMANFLKQNGFSEGKSGRVIALPKIGGFDNVIERIYLDCLANGGRSILDAVAIDLLYGDHLTVRGHFQVDSVKKVQEDMPQSGLIYEPVSS